MAVEGLNLTVPDSSILLVKQLTVRVLRGKVNSKKINHDMELIFGFMLSKEAGIYISLSD